MRVSHTNDACIGLTSKIEETIRRTPSTVQQLCEMLGFSPRAVRVRLDDLMLSGRARYVETVTNGGRGLAYVWHVGPASNEQLDEVRRKQAARAGVVDRGPIGTPSQVTTRAYVPTNRRDPLVAALFGAGPGRSAP